MRHARTFDSSTECEPTSYGTSSTSGTASSSYSSSEYGSGTSPRQTRTKASSTAIRPDSAIQRTSLSWATSRDNSDSDSNDHGPTYSSSSGQDESFNWNWDVERNPKGNNFNTGDGKHAAPGLNGAELFLDPMGPGIHWQTATRGRRRS